MSRIKMFKSDDKPLGREQGLHFLFSASSTPIKRKKNALVSTAISQPSGVARVVTLIARMRSAAIKVESV